MLRYTTSQKRLACGILHHVVGALDRGCCRHPECSCTESSIALNTLGLSRLSLPIAKPEVSLHKVRTSFFSPMK